MTASTPPPAKSGFTQASFEDPAFDPHPGFDFDDTNDAELRHMQESIASLDVYHPSAHPGYQQVGNNSDLNLPSYNAFQVSNPSFSAIDPNDVFADANKQPDSFPPMNAPLPHVFPPEVVQNRASSVTERIGQITPPDQATPALGDRKSSTESQASKAGKLNKSERARNAANQRHAKTKLARQAREARKDAGSGSGSDGSGDEVEGKREKYREKNHLAAAKCRAKKKENVEGLEDKHRGLSATNNFLRREERSLRDELSMLRTAALQHTPAARNCTCHNLHEYNRRKASQVAFGLSGPMVSSPSDGIMSNMNSPCGMDDIMVQPDSAQQNPPDVSHMFGSQMSFSQPGNMSFQRMTSSEQMMDDGSMQVAVGDGNAEFANFLQTSSDGRPRFA